MKHTDNEKQSIREHYLLALLELGGAGEAVNVLVECWKKWPHIFGLPGHRTDHPDARLLGVVAGVRPAWLRKADDAWALTEEGRRVIADLRAGVTLPLPLEQTAEELLEELFRDAPVKRPHPWEEHAELLQQGALSHADWWGFTVELGDGSRDVHYDGGLTPRHYEYFEPFLEDDLAKGTFIKGVIAAMLRELSWHDFQSAWKMLGERHAADPDEIEEEWLPSLVDRLGFDRVAAQVAEAAAECRNRPPASRPTHQGAEDDPVAKLLPPTGQAPFVFRESSTPRGWLVRFSHPDGQVEQGFVPDYKPIRYCRTILERAPQPVRWEELACDPGEAERLREALEAESRFARELPFDDQSYRQCKEQLPQIKERMELLYEQGEDERADGMRPLVERLERDIADYEILRKKPGNPARERIAKKARKYLDRAEEYLSEAGLPGLAEHLAAALRRESSGVTYLPSGNAPAWAF